MIIIKFFHLQYIMESFTQAKEEMVEMEIYLYAIQDKMVSAIRPSGSFLSMEVKMQSIL